MKLKKYIKTLNIEGYYYVDFTIKYKSMLLHCTEQNYEEMLEMVRNKKVCSAFKYEYHGTLTITIKIG